MASRPKRRMDAEWTLDNPTESRLVAARERAWRPLAASLVAACERTWRTLAVVLLQVPVNEPRVDEKSNRVRRFEKRACLRLHVSLLLCFVVLKCLKHFTRLSTVSLLVLRCLKATHLFVSN